MKTIRCQVRMIDRGQVDVTIEDDTQPALLIKAIEEQARREFGEYDNVEVEFIESIPQGEAG